MPSTTIPSTTMPGMFRSVLNRVVSNNNAKQAENKDSEIDEILRQHRAVIRVIGVGGGGGNSIDRMTEVGVAGAHFIAVNTDAQDLVKIKAEKKILIGKDLTGGLGAGADPNIGEQAARENEPELKEALAGADMVFVTCGLGGGTGTGAAPVVAELAKKSGALTIGVVTLPFEMEGHHRWSNAMGGLNRLEMNTDTLIVIPNDKLLQLVPDIPIQTAFKVADEILVNSVKGITELITKPGLINLDFADVRAIMSSGGVALIGVGESDSENRAEDAAKKAVNNPLLDVDITGAKGALIDVIGGDDLTLEEARKIVSSVTDKLDPEAKVIWGAQINEAFKNTVRVLLIVTGVQSAQITGREKVVEKKRKARLEHELGIDFVETEDAELDSGKVRKLS